MIRRMIGRSVLLAAVLLVGVIGIDLQAQPGPYAQQIQSAIRNLTNGTLVFNPLQAVSIIGGTGTTSTLTLQPTSGVGTTGADVIVAVGNNGGTEVLRIRSSTAGGPAVVFTEPNSQGGSTGLFAFRTTGGATTPLSMQEDGTVIGTGTARFAQFQATTQFNWPSGSVLLGTTNKIVQVLDTTAGTGEEFNVGTPTLGTCTAGSLVSGSHNNAGQYTGNTSSSCIINFGTPNWTNTPFCWAMSTASTTHPRISAASTSSITVTGGVSGETINFFCKGRVGT